MKKKKLGVYMDKVFIHKVICNRCGWFNDPTVVKKSNNSKYYKCIKCGNELKTDKDDFKDRLLNKMKGGN